MSVETFNKVIIRNLADNDVVVDDVSQPAFVQVVEVEGTAIGYVGDGGDHGGGGTFINGQLVCQLVAEADALTVPDNLKLFVHSQFTGDEFISTPPPMTPCDPSSNDLARILQETETKLENLQVTDDLSHVVLALFQ